MEDRKRIEVAAAVIWQDGRLFATERGYGAYKDWWEFPGGKLEPGETPREALVRELREEMEADICIHRFLMTVEYDYPEFHLTMHCFLCSFVGGFSLLEHEDARWLAPSQFNSVRWLPADDVVLDRLRKEDKYALLLKRVKSLVQGEPDRLSVMANVSSLLHESFSFWWTGFYRVVESELLLGPFQGPVACMRIPRGKGVCGTAWERAETVVVPDVNQFSNHIACSPDSRSEIVVPMFEEGRVVAVLDIDSRQLAAFDSSDQFNLEQLVRLIP